MVITVGTCCSRLLSGKTMQLNASKHYEEELNKKLGWLVGPFGATA